MNGEHTLRGHHPGSPMYGGRVVSSSSSGSLLRKLTSLAKRSKSQPLLNTRYSTPQSSSQTAPSQSQSHAPPPPSQPTASTSTPHLLSPDRMALAAAQRATLKANATTSITTNANTARPVSGTRRRATTPAQVQAQAQTPVFSSIPVHHTTASRAPLVVQVEIHFPGLDNRPVYVHEYTSSSDLAVTNRLFKGLLRRLHHCSTELITRKDSRATKPQRRQTHNQPSNKPLRYEIHFRILRQDTGLWTERTFYSYQRQDLTSSDAHEVILTTHRMVGLFLRRHDPSFHWSDVPSTETATFSARPEEPALVPHTVGHPLPLSCVPQSRFLEDSQSFEFSPGYAINLTFRSRCHDRKQYEWKRVINLQSKQNAPLNLALAENLLWDTFGSVNNTLTARREAFLEEHKSCEFLEGVVSCQHFGEDALDIELGVENKLGPTFDHLTRSIQSKLGLFRDPDARDCLDFFRTIHGQLVHSRDSADTQIDALPDFDLRILTLCSPTWSVENPARFVLDTPSSYSRRTVEAMLERVQTGVSDVLRNRDCTIHLVAYKRGHLVLDKALIARPLPPRPALFPMPAVFEPADTIVARLKERIHRDLNAVCKDTCSLDGISESAGDEEFPQNNTNTNDTSLPESPSSPLLVPGAFEQTIILQDPAAGLDEEDEQPTVPAPRVVELPDDVFVDAVEQPSPISTSRPTTPGVSTTRRRAFPLIPEKFTLPHSRSSSGVTFASARQTVEEADEEVVELPEAPVEAFEVPVETPAVEVVDTPVEEPVRPVEVSEPVEAVEAIEAAQAVEVVGAAETAEIPVETLAEEPVETVEAEGPKIVEVVDVVEVIEIVEVADSSAETPVETPAEDAVETVVVPVEVVEVAEIDAPIEVVEAPLDTVDAQVDAIDARVLDIDTRVAAIDALVEAIDSFLSSPVDAENPFDMAFEPVEDVEAIDAADAPVEDIKEAVPAFEEPEIETKISSTEVGAVVDAPIDAPVEEVEDKVVAAPEELEAEPIVDNTEIEAPVVDELEQPTPETDSTPELDPELVLQDEAAPVLAAEAEFESEPEAYDDDDTCSSIGGYTFPEMAEPVIYEASAPEPVEEPVQPVVLDSPPMFLNFDDDEEEGLDDLKTQHSVELRFDDNSPSVGTPLETILEYESEEDTELAFDLPSYGEFVPPQQEDFSLFETTPQATPNRAAFTFESGPASESESDVNEEDVSFASSAASQHDHDESFIANTTALTAVSSNCTRPSTPSLSLSSGDINSPQTSLLDTPSIGHEANAAILSCFDSEGSVRFDFRRACGYEAEMEHDHSESANHLNDNDIHNHSPFEFHGVQKQPSSQSLKDNQSLFGQSLGVPPTTISSHHADPVSESESVPTEVAPTTEDTNINANDNNTTDANMYQLLKFDDDDFEFGSSAPGSPVFSTRGLRFMNSYEEFAMTKPTLDLDYADLMADDDDDSDRLSTGSHVEAVDETVEDSLPEVTGPPDIQDHHEDVPVTESERTVEPETVEELDTELSAEPVEEPVDLLVEEPVEEPVSVPATETEAETVDEVTRTPDVDFQDVAASTPLPIGDDLDLISEEAASPTEAPLAVETEADFEATAEDVDAVVEAPAEEPIETVVEAPVEAPIENPVEAPIEEPIETPVEVPAEVSVEAIVETATDEEHESESVILEHVEFAPSSSVETVLKSPIAPESDDVKDVQEEQPSIPVPVKDTIDDLTSTPLDVASIELESVKESTEEPEEEPQQWLTLTVPETEMPTEAVVEVEAEPELASPITPSSDLEEEPMPLLAAEDDEPVKAAEELAQVETEEEAVEDPEQNESLTPTPEVDYFSQDKFVEEPEVEVVPAVVIEQALVDALVDEQKTTADVTEKLSTLSTAHEEQPKEIVEVASEQSQPDSPATLDVIDISEVEVEVVKEPTLEDTTPVLQVPAVEDAVELGVPAALAPLARAVVAIAESLPTPEIPTEMKSLSLDSALRSTPMEQVVQVQKEVADKSQSLISISDLKTIAPPPAPKRMVSWSLPRSGFIGLNETRQFQVGLRSALTGSHAFDDVLVSMKKRQPALVVEAEPTTEEAEDDVSALPQPETLSKSVDERRVHSEAVPSKSEPAPSKKSKRTRTATISSSAATQDNMLPRFMVAFASIAIVSQMINKSS